MKKLLAVLLLSLSILSGCGESNSDKPTLNVFNYGEYIDKDLITKFEKEYDVRVIYSTFDTNEVMYTKVNSGEKYDVIIAGDYMIEKLINDGKLQKLDWNKISNADNLDPDLLDNDYDPGDVYSAPYFWGTYGIIYNTQKVENADVTGWELLKNPKYKGQIYMYDSERDAFVTALMDLGYSINTEDENEINEAYEWLVEQRDLVNPIYVGDEVIDRMISGEKYISTIYSGDAAYVMSENEDMQYYEPEEGTNIWLDGMIITNDCTNVDLAHKWIDFFLDVDNAIANSEAIGYTSPVLEARIELENTTFKGISAYHPRVNLKKDEFFRMQSDNIRSLFADLFTKVKAR